MQELYLYLDLTKNPSTVTKKGSIAKRYLALPEIPGASTKVNKKFLIKTFDNLSQTYSNKFTSNPIEKEKLLSLINFWDIKKSFNILEVGGGTGDLTPFLKEKVGTNGKIYFLDISEKMLEKAKKKLKNYKNIIFLCDDIEALKLKIKFDQFIIFNTFPHIIDKLKAFKNCHKLLKKNGKLIICHNESRTSILLHHKKKTIRNQISQFPESKIVIKDIEKSKFKIQTFENNEGYDYYLVIAQK